MQLEGWLLASCHSAHLLRIETTVLVLMLPSMADPLWNISQRSVNTFHSSVDTPMFSFGLSSFGPQAVGTDTF